MVARKEIAKQPEINTFEGYRELLSEVSSLLEKARQITFRSVNTILTVTYWEVGNRVINFEQKGAIRAKYGEKIIQRLARDLTAKFGKGFGYTNLTLMRNFYLAYQQRKPILQTASEESVSLEKESKTKCFSLSWSHYVKLLSLNEAHQRDFYEEEAIRAGWSVRQLGRQINSSLYERMGLSKNKRKLIEKTEKNILVQNSIL